MITRRKTVIALGAGALSGPFASFAQQKPAKMSRVGVLSPFSASDPATIQLNHRVFGQALRERLWVEGQNIAIERRYAEGKFDRLPDLAAELVRLKADIIVAVTAAAALAVKHATPTIPIVIVVTGDPVGTGLVGSLARPGGNITGGTFDAAPEITAKQLQLLKEIVPRASRVGVLWNPNSAFFASYWEALRVAAPAFAVKLQSLQVREPGELESAFGAMARERANAFMVLSDSFATFHGRRIAELAAKSRLPAMYGHIRYAEAGGLMSYGPEFPHLYRTTAIFVDKILKGAKPADLPLEQPTKFELVINLKTAKAIGITIPQVVLFRADKVIE